MSTKLATLGYQRLAPSTYHPGSQKKSRKPGHTNSLSHARSPAPHGSSAAAPGGCRERPPGGCRRLGAEGKPSKMVKKRRKNGDCHGICFWTIKRCMFFAHRLILKEDFKVNANSLGFFPLLLIDAMFCLPFVPLGCGENVIIRLG